MDAEEGKGGKEDRGEGREVKEGGGGGEGGVKY